MGGGCFVPPVSAFHEFRTVIRNRWSIFEEYGLTGKRFKGKSANWIPKFARRIVSLGERKESGETVRLEKGSVRSFQGRAGGLQVCVCLSFVSAHDTLPIHRQRNHGDSENPTV